MLGQQSVSIVNCRYRLKIILYVYDVFCPPHCCDL